MGDARFGNDHPVVDVDMSKMLLARDAAATVRMSTSPNPWVGSLIVTSDDHHYTGATEPAGGRHAEIVALDAAGARANGSTLYVTLEPCAHHGRTPPCVEALISAGVARVVVAVEDPDPNVAGRGIAGLRDAGIQVDVGIGESEVIEQLSPYLHHRRTGRPWVVLKLAATLDGRTSAADGSSRWITGPEARADVHRLRAQSDAVLVGAGTVRVDDPDLRVRDAQGSDPRRIVLGTAPAGARIHPCTEMTGELFSILGRLGGEMDVVQLLVEGGPTVAGEFHRQGLVNEYRLYLAPALMGGSDGAPVLAGSGAASIAELWRGNLTGVTRLGPDVRIDLEPAVAR